MATLQEKVYNVLKNKSDFMTVKEIAEQTDIKPASIYVYLTRLKKDGFASNDLGKWILISKQVGDTECLNKIMNDAFSIFSSKKMGFR